MLNVLSDYEESRSTKLLVELGFYITYTLGNASLGKAHSSCMTTRTTCYKARSRERFETMLQLL